MLIRYAAQPTQRAERASRGRDPKTLSLHASRLSFAMMTQAAEMSAELPCYRCGYDLRAHSQDGKCPECGASVAESRQMASIPRRPAWRDSDPRWRRRMLVGTWVLVLLPLIDALKAFGWA